MPPAAVKMIEELVLAALISDKVLTYRNFRTDFALSALSVLLAGAGIFFAAVALDRWLESFYPPDMAALVAAGIALCAAGAVAFFSWRQYGRRKLGLSRARAEIGRNIKGLIEDVLQEVDGPVRDNPKTAILIAAIAGFFTAGGVSHMRH